MRVTTKLGGQLTKIGPGIYLDLPAGVECEPDEIGSPYHVRLTIDVNEGRLGCTELTVTASGGETISGTALRGVPVASIVSQALHDLVRRGETRGGMRTYWPFRPDVDVSAGPTVEALRAVATSYSIAYALGEPPAKGVAHDLGLPTSTAGRWIKLARDRGLLEIPADKGRKS
jgi:hypothetical protein